MKPVNKPQPLGHRNGFLGDRDVRLSEFEYLMSLFSSLGTFVSIGGDTMTGFLTLHADPVNPNHAATKVFVENHVATQISNLINGAPILLDTLKELADAINNDPNFYSSVVLDTDLATWAGSTNLTTLGTITSGTWNGTSIDTTYTDAKLKTLTGTVDNITIGGTATDPIVAIAATYAGQNTITTLGTITTGIWNGTSISTNYTDAKLKTLTGTASRIVVGGTATDPTVDISAFYTGQNTITTLGTITTGTWNGSVVAIAYGGTNSSTALNNNRMMVSSGGAIVEHSAQTASRVSFYDSNGLPTGDSKMTYTSGNGVFSTSGTANTITTTSSGGTESVYASSTAPSQSATRGVIVGRYAGSGSTSSVVRGIDVENLTTGLVAVGIGAAYGFRIKSAAGQTVGALVGSVETSLTVLGAGNEQSKMVFKVANLGILSEYASITYQGLAIGTNTSFGTSASNTLVILNGSSPASSPTDAFQVYSADIIAGNAAFHTRSENGDIVRIYSIGGWGTPTGTLTRTTFDTTTVTVEQLAERVAAMISDFKTGHQLFKA